MVSYYASRPSNDIVTAAWQKVTHDWWEKRANDFEIYISQYVLDEISSGDADAAAQRLDLVKGFKQLQTEEEIMVLAESLLEKHSLPQKARMDAIHLAVSAVHGIDFLLTWNCRHLANAALWDSMANVCHDHDFAMPIICTPQELIEGTK